MPFILYPAGDRRRNNRALIATIVLLSWTQLLIVGYFIVDEDAARPSPFGQEHDDMLARHLFMVHDSLARGELRPPLRSLSENP